MPVVPLKTLGWATELVSAAWSIAAENASHVNKALNNIATTILLGHIAQKNPSMALIQKVVIRQSWSRQNILLYIFLILLICRSCTALCAGITMYSPFRHWKVGPGMKLGIVGLGGLGHMGVKYAKAMGADVEVITSSPEKADSAKSYGASDVVVSSSEQDMKKARRKMVCAIRRCQLRTSRPYFLSSLVLVMGYSPLNRGQSRFERRHLYVPQRVNIEGLYQSGLKNCSDT